MLDRERTDGAQQQKRRDDKDAHGVDDDRQDRHSLDGHVLFGVDADADD